MYIDIKNIRKIHLALMVLDLIPNTIVALALLFIRESFGVTTAFGTEGMFFAMNVSSVIVQGLALVCGIIYTARNYTKDAADYYKYFMLLYAISKLFTLYSSFMLSGVNLYMIVTLVEVVLISSFAFVKDLGRQRSMMLFYALLVCELLVGLTGGFTDVSSAFAPRLVAGITRLLLCGTLGLAIYGKYDDKARRGTN
jgi:hypothetical protein